MNSGFLGAAPQGGRGSCEPQKDLEEVVGVLRTRLWLTSALKQNSFLLCPGEDSADLIRHFLVESSAKGVHLKGADEEPYFGKPPQPPYPPQPLQPPYPPQPPGLPNLPSLCSLHSFLSLPSLSPLPPQPPYPSQPPQPPQPP